MTSVEYQRLMRAYLDAQTPFWERNSIVYCAGLFRRFGEWIRRERCDVTAKSVLRWTREQQQARVANGVIHNRKALARLFAWGMEQKMCVGQYVTKIPTLVAQPSKQTNFTAEEYAKLRAYGWPRSWWFLGHVACVCWETGLRISDVCLLRWETVDMDNGVISLVPKKTKRYGKSVEIPITDELRGALNSMAIQRARPAGECPESGSPYVFAVLAYYYLTPEGSCQASQQLRRACAKLGIPMGKGWHSLRHSFVSRLVAAGVNPAIVGSMTGQSMATLQRYVHIDLQTKLAALQKT